MTIRSKNVGFHHRRQPGDTAAGSAPSAAVAHSLLDAMEMRCPPEVKDPQWSLLEQIGTRPGND
jgi:hypothetical protein